MSAFRILDVTVIAGVGVVMLKPLVVIINFRIKI